MNKFLSFLEQAFTVISLMIYSGSVVILVLSGGNSSESGSGAQYDTSIYQILFLSIYAITFFLLLIRWKKTIYTLIQNIPVVIFILFLISSILWSFEPGSTISETIKIIGSTSFGLYLASRYTLRDQIRLVGLTFGIAILLSFLFIFLLPQYGISGGIHAGAWRGVYLHKNTLGTRMVWSISTFLILLFGDKIKKPILLLGILLSAILILFSRSSSSLVNATLVFFIFFLIQPLQWKYRSMVVYFSGTLAILIAFTGVLASNAELLVGLLGKDLTLSGRTVIWGAVWQMIQRHPWLGYGYGGFWHGLDGESVYVFNATGWLMTHSHNGFIELWLNLGFIGLSLFLISYVVNFWSSIRFLRITKNTLGIFPVLNLILILLTNFNESPLLGDFSWLTYTSLSFTISTQLQEMRRSFKNYSLGVGFHQDA